MKRDGVNPRMFQKIETLKQTIRHKMQYAFLEVRNCLFRASKFTLKQENNCQRGHEREVSEK